MTNERKKAIRQRDAGLQRLKRYPQREDHKSKITELRATSSDELVIAENQEQKPVFTDEIPTVESQEQKPVISDELPLAEQPRLECILESQGLQPPIKKPLMEVGTLDQHNLLDICKRETFVVETGECYDTQGPSIEEYDFTDKAKTGCLAVPGHSKDYTCRSNDTNPVFGTSFGFQVKIEKTVDGEHPFVNNEHPNSRSRSVASSVSINQCPQFDRTSGDNIPCMFPVCVKTEPQGDIEGDINSECDECEGKFSKLIFNPDCHNLPLNVQALKRDEATVPTQINALRAFLYFE